MSTTYIGSFTVGDMFPSTFEFSQKVGTLIAAYAAVQDTIGNSLGALLDVLSTLEGGLKFLVDAPFGLGALKLTATLEFQGSIKAMASLGIAMVNPLGQISGAITAMAAATAGLIASLSLGLPAISAELGSQLSAMAAVSAAAAAKMAGIQMVIEAAMSLLGPLVNVRSLVEGLLSLFAALSSAFAPVATMLGSFVLQWPHAGAYAWVTAGPYSEGIDVGPPPAGLSLDTIVNGVSILTSSSTPDTWASIQFMVRTS